MPPKKRPFLHAKKYYKRRAIVQNQTDNEENNLEQPSTSGIRNYEQPSTSRALSSYEESSEDSDHQSESKINAINELSGKQNRKIEIMQFRNIKRRVQESDEHRNLRLENDRLRHTETRIGESDEHRNLRLENDRLRHTETRIGESDEHRNLRLENDRLRHTEARAEESDEQRAHRMEADRQRFAVTISSETEEQRNLRLNTANSRQRVTRLTGWGSLTNKAFNYDPTTVFENFSILNIGEMDDVCQHCEARRWKAEPKSLCCNNGKIKLTQIQSPPEPLKSLLSGMSPDSRNFLSLIRQYNSSFQMTSFGVTKEVRESGFMPTFKVQGQIYHRIGSLLPRTSTSNESHKFLQIYFMGDEELEKNTRCENFPRLNQNIALSLQQMLHRCNSYVRSFKTALEMLPTDDYRVVIRADKKPPTEHQGRFNAPTSNEIAVIIVGDECNSRDIILKKKDGELQSVSETNRSYDALQYPLIFCRGEDGYHFQIMQHNLTTGTFNLNKKVSAMDFYCHRMMVRTTGSNHILECRQLFNQFAVDMYVKIESERLLYIRLNQNKLRVESYIHLRDAISNETNPNDVGQLTILPSTYIGSPRHMHEYTQDAMTYVRNFGRPDLFITFTCNPKWIEIQSELFSGQSHHHRHDLIARVFKLKLQKLMEVISKGEVFGSVQSKIYTIEWQKRGLPHAHILIWLHEKIRPQQIDEIICAELPDPARDPVLHKIISKNMIHGPCGVSNNSSPCMKDNRCTKGYPRKMTAETQTGNDGYPLYRRRNTEEGGFTTSVKVKGQDVTIDNRWVVPYCPLLSKIFEAHINVEYCHSVKAIKYICNYINKGSDQAIFGLKNGAAATDEVSCYQLGRYVSTNEALWRIFGFQIHDRYPAVLHLAVHLENGQRVYFTERNLSERILNPPRTTLTAFFELCRDDEFARTLLYCDVPKYYTWDKSRKVFKRRIQGTAVPHHSGIKKSDALGRVYTVHPSNFECFCLRLLLHNVVGPISFSSIKTVEGVVCSTFREACQLRGLLEDDAHWDTTLTEAAVSESPAKLRHLFAIVLTVCSPSDPKRLWDSHKISMTEDILMEFRRKHPDLPEVSCTPEMFNKSLILIEDLILKMCNKKIDKFGLESPQRNADDDLNYELAREMNYNREELHRFVEDNEHLLVADQKIAYNKILSFVEEEKSGMFFIDAPGGTGKTFLLNLILSKIREKGSIAIAVASSGIAATLLCGGRTAHSTFKIPIDILRSENPVCNISRGTTTAMILQKCAIIIWDECTMAHKHALEALDRTLRDIRDVNQTMGGVTVVLAGDFRQTLPVIPKGTMADEIKACLKSSYLWDSIIKLELKTNMRIHLQGDLSFGEFAENLLNIGEGKISPSEDGRIGFPDNFCNIVDSVDALKSCVFPDIENNFNNQTWLFERAILAPKYKSVDSVNHSLLDMLPGAVITYLSIDTTVETEESVNYPVEFLNSIHPPGMPLHTLLLKIGAPIILLRNLDAPRLCNGTRLCIKKLMPNVIEATIVTGCAKGEDVFIPRIPLITTDMPFQFKRLQFPVRLAFAVTINKAQGQSLKVAGIDLSDDCFAHGQLYVACSRVGTGKNLHVFAKNGKTKNVVYKKVL